MIGGITDKLLLRSPFFWRDEVTLNILQKYIFREWLWTFFAVTIVLLVILIGVALGELLSDIAGGRIPSGLLWTLIMLKMPQVLGTIVPLSVFISIIWGLGRLYRDQEMSVMRSSGFKWQMLLRPLFNLIFPVAVVLMFLGLFVAPSAASLTQQKLLDAFRNAAEWGLQPGQFHVLKSGDLVLYVESVEKDGRTLNNVFIQLKQDERKQVWSAEKGYYWLDKDSGNRFLTLENGQMTEGGSETLDFGVMRFSRTDLRLPEEEDQVELDSIETKPSVDILFSSSLEDIVEVQWRIAPVFVVVVLGLMAIPLSHAPPREGRGGRALLGILAYMVYVNTLYMSRNWLLKGDMPITIGLWWIHLLALVIALIWLRRQGRMVGVG
ncbi:MAG: LPS export ABC transporter permease LptF [Xanthomonadales bacterium]|nr:LPS export ABC transporter permease LptF [Gammaproteobacteria bacterium]MBT8052642.1 LPS export ABC transporter permease LptF [Gammaproteobacteria bacterium]NND56599.1 LPS export ABC transporter permease LptF [Xanthomonadales bacterium]NNK52459.1 LPS export ABC transporter permease LptF [Xanthomonadales bacterium]